MDSYAGLPEHHPAHSSIFLRQHLTQRVAMKEFFGIDGNPPDPELACREYADKLRSAKPQLCLAGIGKTDTWRLTIHPRRTLTIHSCKDRSAG